MEEWLSKLKIGDIVEVKLTSISPSCIPPQFSPVFKITHIGMFAIRAGNWGFSRKTGKYYDGSLTASLCPIGEINEQLDLCFTIR
jgi:hypothetical protein